MSRCNPFRIPAENLKSVQCVAYITAPLYIATPRHAPTPRHAMSVICQGCGRTFTLRGYNSHHSRQDAKTECQGRDKSQVATVAVNARHYRVSVQPALSMHARPGSESGGPGRRGSLSHGDLDSEDPAAPSVDSDAESGPGESCNECKYHHEVKTFGMIETLDMCHE